MSFYWSLFKSSKGALWRRRDFYLQFPHFSWCWNSCSMLCFIFPCLVGTSSLVHYSAQQLQPGLRVSLCAELPRSPLYLHRASWIWQRIMRGCQVLKAPERFTAAPLQFGELPQNSCYMRGTPHLPSTATPRVLCEEHRRRAGSLSCPSWAQGHRTLCSCQAPARIRILAVIAMPAASPPRRHMLPLCYVKICSKAHFSSKLT